MHACRLRVATHLKSADSLDSRLSTATYCSAARVTRAGVKSDDWVSHRDSGRRNCHRQAAAACSPRAHIAKLRPEHAPLASAETFSMIDSVWATGVLTVSIIAAFGWLHTAEAWTVEAA